MLPWVYSFIDQKRRQNVVKTSVPHLPMKRIFHLLLNRTHGNIESFYNMLPTFGWRNLSDKPLLWSISQQQAYLVGKVVVIHRGE